MSASARDQGERRLQSRRHARSPEPKPLTHGHIRRANAWAVLQAVRALGTTSRTQITEQTGLTPMSVHRLVAELKRRKLVVSSGRSPAGSVGRPSSLFRFNASIGHVVGFDVGNETTRAVLADLGGTQRARLEFHTDDIEADLAGSLLSAVAGLQEVAGVRADGLVGLAVGVPAVTRPDGTIVRASQHRRWDGLELGARLGQPLATDVIVRQDDHLAAMAELRGGACAGVRTAVVVNAGKGIGLGIIVDGTVHSGHRGAAGRATWIPVPTSDGDGPMVPLGSVLTADGLIADYRVAGGTAPVDGARGVFLADADGDPAAALAIDRFARRLGWLIGTIASVLDPEVVVVGGGISRSYARLADQVTESLRKIIASPPPVVASKLGPEAVILGAIDAATGLGDAWLQARIRA